MPFISYEATITIAYLVDSVNRFFPISRNSGNSTRNIMFFYYSDERDFLAPSASVFRPPLPRIFVPPPLPVFALPVPHSRVCLSSRSRALPAPRFRTPAPCFSLPPSPLPTSYRLFSPMAPRPTAHSGRIIPGPLRRNNSPCKSPSPARPPSVLASGKTHRSDKANGRQTVSEPAVPRLLRLRLIAHGFFLLISGTSVRPKI